MLRLLFSADGAFDFDEVRKEVFEYVKDHKEKFQDDKNKISQYIRNNYSMELKQAHNLAAEIHQQVFGKN